MATEETVLGGGGGAIKPLGAQLSQWSSHVGSLFLIAAWWN